MPKGLPAAPLAPLAVSRFNDGGVERRKMRTLEVTREFHEKCVELARVAKVPEIRSRLWRLANDYQSKLEALERAESGSIVPESPDTTSPT